MLKQQHALLRALAAMCVLGSMIIAAESALAQQDDKSAAETKPNSTAKKPKVVIQRETYLGVGVAPLHPAMWAHMSDLLEHKQGLMVTHVTKGSPAEKAGIKQHDILMTFGDQKLFSPEQLIALVHNAKVGQKVKLSIVRDGKSEGVEAMLTDHSVGIAEMPTKTSRWRMPHWWSRPKPAETNWESFDSLTMKRLEDDRYQVEIGYKTKDGKFEHMTFEGTLDAIHRDILAQKDLPAEEREHLLRALDKPLDDFQVELPDFLVSPDGDPFFDFPEVRELPRLLLPNDF